MYLLDTDIVIYALKGRPAMTARSVPPAPKQTSRA